MKRLIKEIPQVCPYFAEAPVQTGPRTAGLHMDRPAESYFLLERNRLVSNGQLGVADFSNPEYSMRKRAGQPFDMERSARMV